MSQSKEKSSNSKNPKADQKAVENSAPQKTKSKKDQDSKDQKAGPKVNLFKEFKAETREQKIFLFMALAVIIGSIAPWQLQRYGYGFGGAFAVISMIGAIAVITHWILIKYQVDLPNFLKDEKLTHKILAAIMLVGPLLLIVINLISEYSFGFWITLIAAAVSFFFIFHDEIQKLKKNLEEKE
jgi:signal transduction histidine kinase